MAKIYTSVQASQVSERIAAMAEEIESSQPVLVGLQEVGIWRTGPFNPVVHSPTAAHIRYDFLQLLLDELSARGLHYAAIAVITNFDAEAPAVFSASLAFNVRYTDRDVVLARTDLGTSELKVEGIEAQNFATNITIPTAVLGPITLPRGWVAVDAKYRGQQYRFVNTHLEPFSPIVQLAQARELLQGPGATTRALIFAGDFNSDAESNDPEQNATYQLLTDAGFSDAWKDTHPDEPGYTWPLFGKDLLPLLSPSERLDLVLTRGKVDSVASDILGEDPQTDLTPSGLLPSDHAGVIAVLQLLP